MLNPQAWSGSKVPRWLSTYVCCMLIRETSETLMWACAQSIAIWHWICWACFWASIMEVGGYRLRLLNGGVERWERVSALWARWLPWTLECLSLSLSCAHSLSFSPVILFITGQRKLVYIRPQNTLAHKKFKGVWDLFGLSVLNVYGLCVYSMLL